MAYSTIMQKKGKCIDCVAGGDSSEKAIIAERCNFHYRNYLNKKSYDKRKLQSNVKSLHTPENDEAVRKQIWFSERRKEMSGWCQCGLCGNPSSKNDDKNFRSSACHILPQRHFESVRWHPLNWIELAFFGGCHTNMDNQGSMEWDKMKCWPEIVRRFKVLYPLTYTYERQFIPKILQQFLPQLETLINI